jgi:hypothetical protein
MLSPFPRGTSPPRAAVPRIFSSPGPSGGGEWRGALKTTRGPAEFDALAFATLGIYGRRDQTDLETAMEAYARRLEQEQESEIVPPEADR